MFVHPEFDPIAISIGPVAIRWYGLMYLLAFVAFIMLAKRRLHLFPAIKMSDVDNMLTWAVLGVILGGRLGYVFFTSLTTTWPTLAKFSQFGKAECLFMVGFSACCWCVLFTAGTKTGSFLM